MAGTMSSMRRQQDVEVRAVPDHAVGEDEAVVLLDDAVHGRQPEAGAASGFLGGEKRLEDVRQDVVSDTDAVVGNRDLDVCRRLRPRAPDTVKGVSISRFRCDTGACRRAAWRRGHSPRGSGSPGRTGSGPPWPSRRPDRGRHGRSICSPMIRRRSFSISRMRSLMSTSMVWMVWRRLKASNWRVSSPARSEAARMSCSTALLLRLHRVFLVDQHLRVARDDGQQVVEVVRDSARQPPDRFHPRALQRVVGRLERARDPVHVAQGSLHQVTCLEATGS